MKVLIVKIGAIGDVIMALSIVEALRAQAPEARVTWLCGQSVESLLRAYGKIDEIIVLNDQHLLVGNFFQKLSVLIQVWTKLFFRSFDLVITGHSDSRYRLLSLATWAVIRRGFGARGQGRGGPLPGRYHGDEYVRLATGQDGPQAPAASLPKWRLSPDASWQKLFSVHPKPWIALAPGGAKNILRDDDLRRWPMKNYVQLAGKLSTAGFQVVLTGSEGDRWVEDHFKSADCLNFVGKTSLIELVALYGHCQLVVTHDSGPMHLAALSGAKVLALFGPTAPSEKVQRNGSIRPLWGGESLACRPCYDGKNYADCAHNLCMVDLSLEKVATEALGMVRGND